MEQRLLDRLDVMQLDKLKKLLALSESDNDNEALAAIRQVNKLLKEANLTWPEFLEIDRTMANDKYEQLRHQYAILASKYNELVRAVAAQQAAALLGVPHRTASRRRTRRL